MYDIIGRTYGVLPSDVAKLQWADLLVCVQCVRARGDRVKRILKTNKRKKSTVFPNISIIASKMQHTCSIQKHMAVNTPATTANAAT